MFKLKLDKSEKQELITHIVIGLFEKKVEVKDSYIETYIDVSCYSKVDAFLICLCFNQV
jgi:hypothetical protein